MFPSRNFKITNNKIRKRGKLPYSSKTYNNPFFTRKKRFSSRITGYKLSPKTKLITSAVLVSTAALVFVFFYSDFFSIKKITAQGSGRIDPLNIEQIAWEQINNNLIAVIPQKNIFLFSKQKLIKNLNKKYSFKDLVIDKKLPGRLEIKFNEKEYAVIWQENDNYFYLDDYGAVIDEVNLLEISQKDYPIIKNDSNRLLVDRNISVDHSLVDCAKQLFIKFKDYSAEFQVDRFVVDSEINTVKVLLAEGPAVYFNSTLDLDKQIAKLLVIKNEKLKQDFAAKIYIDVRYGDSVYYR